MLYKGYRIEPLGTFPLYKIMPAKSGNIPDKLLGNYTTRNLAITAVDTYLNSLLTKTRKPKNDQKESPASS